MSDLPPELAAKYPPLDEAQQPLFADDLTRAPGECLPGDVQRVFNHWVAKTWSGKGVTPRLTEKRRRLLQRCIKEYGLQAAMAVTDGALTSDWHVGANPGGKRYLSIELLYRDAEHIERFVEMADEADDTSEPF